MSDTPAAQFADTEADDGGIMSERLVAGDDACTCGHIQWLHGEWGCWLAVCDCTSFDRDDDA